MLSSNNILSPAHGRPLNPLDDAAGPILNNLSRVFDLQAEASAVAKIISDRFGVITDNDQEVLNSGSV